MRFGRRQVMLAATYALLLVSCDSPLSSDETTIGQIDVNPIATTISVGETRPVSARVLDASGNTLTGRPLFWSTQNAAVASVTQAGIITGVSAGGTQVAVSAGGKSGIVAVTVNARPVSLVRVTPATVSLVAGSTTTLSAEPLDAGGATVSGRPVLWATSNADIATVTSTGVVSGVAAGSANITATVDGVVGTSVVTVQPVPIANLTLTPPTGTLILGQQLQLTATPRDAAGAVLSGRTITWSSSEPTTASVSSTGVVTALARGTATITASSEGQSATSRITVSLIPIDTIAVSPSTATLAAGQTLQLTTRVVDSTGAVLTGRTITWDTDQPSFATVSTNGLVTGITAGRATITASAGGKSASAVITVTPVPVASVRITPVSATLVVGGTQQFTATTRDASNNVLPGRIITWISGAPSVASVDQAGLVKAVGPGSALIFAASEGVSTSVGVTVTSVGVATVRITPSVGSVQQGRTLQLSAAPLDGSGNPISGRTVTWNSASPGIASVSSTGLVTGITNGTTTISATVDGVVGSAGITVTAIPVASVSIVPPSPTLSVGTSVTLTALLADASGAPLSPAGRTISWSTTAPSVATINPVGVVTAISSGTAIMQALVEGVSAQTNVTVTGIPVANVSLTPATSSLALGQTRSITAAAFDAGGAPLPGRPATWSSSNVAVATVNTATSLLANTITAVGPGTATIRAVIGGVTGVSTVTVTAVPIATISLSPSPGNVRERQTLQLTATVRDASNNILTGRTLVWSSSSNAIASVSQGGLVTANVPGTVTISASADGQGANGSNPPPGTSQVTVDFAPVASVISAPAVTTLAVGGSTTLGATLLDGAGQPLTVTGRTIAWRSLNTAIATVSPGGVVTGVAAGGPVGIEISAASPSQSPPALDTSLVTVSQVQVARLALVPLAGTLHIGSTYARTLQAQVFDVNNNPLTGRSILWSTENNNPSVTFSSATTSTGQVTVTGAIAPGTVRVIAATLGGTTGTVADTADVVVDLVAISSTTSSVSLTPSSQADSVVPGPAQLRTYVATPRDSAGNVIAGAALGARLPVWSISSGANFATIVASGASATVTPTSPGTATVAAAYGGTGPSATLRVIPPVASILMTVAPDSFLVGGTATLTATARDGSNTPIPGRTISLSSVPANATFSVSSGAQSITTTVTGVAAPGGRASTTLMATAPLDGLSNSLTVRVLAPVSVVSVSAPADSIFVTTNLQATATLRDASGNVLTGRPITWGTGDAQIATVDQSGIVTGVAAGTTTVRATETTSAVTGSKSLKVQERVNSVTLEAADSSIAVGLTQPTTVTLLDRLGATIIGRPVTYTSSDPSVATVSSTGVITAVKVGTTNITATSEQRTSPGLPFAVTPPVVTSVTMSASPTPNVYPSHSFPATVSAFDVIGNPVSLTGRTLVWTSSAPSIAGVTAGSAGSATITAVAVGTATISASVDGVAAATPVSITVNRVPVVTVTLTQSATSIVIGVAQNLFAAAARDSVGGILTGRLMTWQSSNTAKVIIDASTAAVSAVDTGAVTITATATNAGFQGASPSASAPLTATLIPISSVTLTPSTLSLPATSAAASLVANVLDVINKGMPGRTCAVVSSNPSVLSITSAATALTDANGQVPVSVKGVSPGSVIVTVTCDPSAVAPQPSPRSGTATVTVP